MTVKVLLVGVGGVGESIAVMAKERPWITKMVLTDYNLKRAKEVQKKIGDKKRFPVEFIDAGDRKMIQELAKKYEVDLIMNACDPVFNEPIFDAAYDVGCTYMDMAMTLSKPHPTTRSSNAASNWAITSSSAPRNGRRRALLALVGLGVEPGMADVFARYAQDYLFDEIEEIGVRDGANLEVRGYEFAPNFSIWTTIEECLNPPVVWEKDKGWFTTEPFSEPEIFEFPEGIGKIEVVNVEHEEVLLVPRWVKTQTRHVQVWPGRPVHRRAQDPAHARPRQQGKDQGQGCDGCAARRGGRLPARSRPPGRQDVRQDLRRASG